ncbi:MAG: HD domain-containing phosphohydrolase [Pseudomonadota bacterium]
MSERTPIPAEAHRRLAQVQGIVPGVLYVCRDDPEWTMKWISDDIADLAGIAPEALLGNRYRAFTDLIHPDDRERVAEAIRQARDAGEPFQVQYRLLAADGSERLVWEKGRTIGEDPDGTPLLEGYIADLTESRETQRHLAASEARFRQLFNSLTDMAFVWEGRADGQPGHLVEVNDAACECLGYTRSELLAMTAEQLNLTTASARPEGKESELPGRDGTGIPVEIRVQPMAIEGKSLSLYIARDLREEKARQRLLQRTSRAMGILSQTNQTIVHAPDSETLLQRVVEGLQRNAEYSLVWAACVEENGAGPRLQGVVARGQPEGVVERPDFHESPAGDPENNVVAAAFRQDARAVDVLDAAAIGEGGWRAALHAGGIRSVCVLPWHHQNGRGLVGLASRESGAFDHTGEVEILEEAVGDLGFGLTALQAREGLHREVARREEALENTIHSMGRSLEERDPYTAGHQERVAELAVAIGEELGLEADRILGLRLGAWVHDIGKLKVPMEILNKPGRLTESEFGVIKEHPEVGLRILGDIEFRWPIRDMIHHHHERLDGSGYPDGLTAEALSMEVRILAVADTVEAVTSHRPYRPGRGMEWAQKILQAERGTRLDAEVVDACLRLFEEGRFEWSALQDTGERS